MELETLRTLWQDQELPEQETSREELLALLQKRSGAPIARMLRNLRFEALLIALSYLPCVLFYWLGFDGRMAGVGWLMLVCALFFLVYYYFKNRLLRQMLCVTCEVRSNLSRQLTTLKKYLRFYFWSSTLIVPVMVCIAFGLILYTRPASAPPFRWLLGLSLLFLLVLACTVVVYFFNRWYINKLYGRHIGKLQQLLQEMDEA